MLRALTVVLLFLAPGLAQGVIRVGLGRQFTDLQAAIDFARAGDRILVDPGTYASAAFPDRFTISKGVRITGQAGVVLTTVVVSGLPAGETVTLAGVEIQGYASTAGTVNCVSVVSSAGAVFLDQCRLTGASCWYCSPFNYPRLFGNRAALVAASQCTVAPSLGAHASQFIASVGMLTDCGMLSTVQGAYYSHGQVSPVAAGPGLDCQAGSVVQLARTGLRAGAALPGLPFTAPGSGAPGATIASSELHLAGPATITGGTGGTAFVQGNYLQGGDGGPGVQQNGTLFHDTGVTLAGGAGGQGTPPGLPGAPLTGTPATVVSLPSLSTTTLQLPGSSFQLDGFAPPGNFLYLLVAFETLPMNIPGVRGRLAPRLDSLLFVEGPILVGASGRVTRTFPIPADPNLSGVVLFAQAAGVDPAALPLAFFSAAVPMTVGF